MDSEVKDLALAQRRKKRIEWAFNPCPFFSACASIYRHAAIRPAGAKLKLEAMSVKIDRLTVEKEEHLANRSEAA